MRYIKINKDLLTVFGESARNTDLMGFAIYPQHQMDNKASGMAISYGAIYDESKFDVTHEAVTVFETKEEVNADILAEYQCDFIVTNIEMLKFDVELSGGVSAIAGYDRTKSLESQENLATLFQYGEMAGIGVTRIADFFI